MIKYCDLKQVFFELANSAQKHWFSCHFDWNECGDLIFSIDPMRIIDLDFIYDYGWTRTTKLSYE